MTPSPASFCSSRRPAFPAEDLRHFSSLCAVLSAVPQQRCHPERRNARDLLLLLNAAPASCRPSCVILRAVAALFSPPAFRARGHGFTPYPRLISPSALPRPA